MTGERSLFDVLDPDSITYDQETYDQENPEVWLEFQTLALQLIERGVRHYGAKAIFEVLRYHRTLETADPEYKINNNYTSYYARKFIRRHPRHSDFFEVRRSRFDSMSV